MAMVHTHYTRLMGAHRNDTAPARPPASFCAWVASEWSRCGIRFAARIHGCLLLLQRWHVYCEGALDRTLPVELCLAAARASCRSIWILVTARIDLYCARYPRAADAQAL